MQRLQIPSHYEDTLEKLVPLPGAFVRSDYCLFYMTLGFLFEIF